MYSMCPDIEPDFMVDIFVNAWSITEADAPCARPSTNVQTANAFIMVCFILIVLWVIYKVYHSGRGCLLRWQLMILRFFKMW